VGRWKRNGSGLLLRRQHVKDQPSISGGVVGLRWHQWHQWHQRQRLSKCWKLPAAPRVLPGGDAGRPAAAAARVGLDAGVGAPPVESGGSGQEGVAGQRSVIPRAPAPAAAPAVPGNRKRRPQICRSWSYNFRFSVLLYQGMVNASIGY
jgi:hypothetical protein